MCDQSREGTNEKVILNSQLSLHDSQKWCNFMWIQNSRGAETREV